MSFNLLHERIQKAVADTGYSKPTPIQERAIPRVLKGADVIGIAQTGTGKTAAFTLPLLSNLVERTEAKEERCTRVLIIAPTRELVSQIHDNVRAYAKYTNLRTAAIHGGISDKGQIEKLNSGVDIIIATPGRLLDLTESGHGSFSQIEALVLDEADRMLDMGFIPDIRTICKRLPKSRQTLLFSATFSPQIEALTKEFLNSPSLVEVDRRANPAETITQSIYEVFEHQKFELLEHLLESSHHFYAVMVFARTREGCEELATALRAAKISAEAIHGDKKQGQRRKALRDFKEGKIRVLVATDVAARGIDIEGVTHVINYDFPEHSEDYIHRIGRTGRAEAEGEAITFTTPANQLALRKLEKLIRVTLPRKKAPGFAYDKEPIQEEAPARKLEKKEKKDYFGPSKFSQKNKPQQRGGKAKPGRRKPAAKKSAPRRKKR
ncbi:ATP-dependent RNA helicase RhlE [Rubritalea halochordaticola]|uniref:ATP-dependent RNA helicase RhlE n=1 Tax=Rubritalea halochordaticola TaxID=714537 RepID=A0ABP9V0T6_9BACT